MAWILEICISKPFKNFTSACLKVCGTFPDEIEWLMLIMTGRMTFNTVGRLAMKLAVHRDGNNLDGVHLMSSARCAEDWVLTSGQCDGGCEFPLTVDLSNRFLYGVVDFLNLSLWLLSSILLSRQRFQQKPHPDLLWLSSISPSNSLNVYTIKMFLTSQFSRPAVIMIYSSRSA